MRVSVSLYDDELPDNQAILVNGQASLERLEDVGYFLGNLGSGYLNPDHDERPA